MRHLVDERKLGVKTPHRLAMLANLASSLVLSDRIETTLTKAKELRRIADRIVTLGKRGTVHAARQARAILRNREAVHKLFTELPKRYEKRNGGYTRILKLGYRHGDSAPMAMIEYVDSPQKVKKEAEKGKGKEEAKPEKAKKPAMTLRERVLGRKAKAQPIEPHAEKKAPARKVPQQRAKKEA